MKLNYPKLVIFITLLGYSVALSGQSIVIEDREYADINGKLKDIFDDSFDTDCLDVSIERATNLSLNGISTFNRGNSEFPFDTGFVLSTGQAQMSIGPNKSLRTSSVSEPFGGIYTIQEILDDRIGTVGQYSESKAIKLRFVSQTDFFNLNYIFASESYKVGDIECFDGDSSKQDGFAILLTGPGITPDTFDHDNDTTTPEIEYVHHGKNIALLPDQVTQVGLHSIHNNPECNNLGFQSYFIEQEVGTGEIEANGRTVPLTAVSPIIPGEVYELEIILTNRGDNSLDSWLFIEFAQKPIVPDLEDTYFICKENTNSNNYQSIFIDTDIDDPKYSFQWFLDGDLLSDQTNNNVEVFVPGEYSVNIVAPNGCSRTYSFSVVESSIPFDLAYSLSGELFTNQQTVEISTTGISDYLYSLNGIEQSSSTFTSIAPGTYHLVVKDINGCGEAGLDFTIVDYPKFFSPNGDDINDIWRPNMGNISKDGNVFIYDRYGKMLNNFSLKNGSWDGVFNGNRMPPADYWFIINFKDGQVFKGHFSLIR